MKVIISEIQQNLLTEKFTEENLRKLCYQIWDRQKNMGQDPYIDDVIYDVSGIVKNTLEDYYTIRPIWYRYNGGLNKLYKKLREEVLGKTFRVVFSNINLDTNVKVVDVDLAMSNHLKYYVVDLICDVDDQGTIDYEIYDDETDTYSPEIITIEGAYFESMVTYESGELKGTINHYCYEFFYELLEKYGIAIDLDVELKNLK